MKTVYFKGTPFQISGNVPAVGDKAPDFSLTTKELGALTLSDLEGKKVVLNVFPSLDTPVCAASVRRFNQEAAKLDNTTVVCVSMDLPFAQERFCTANDIANVVVTSAFRSPEFGQKYGLRLVDGPMEGLLARAVIVLNEKHDVVYSGLVSEITEEPKYEEALNALNCAK